MRVFDIEVTDNLAKSAIDIITLSATIVKHKLAYRALLTLLTRVAVAADQPNVVIMLADNVGDGDIGAYGAGEIRGMPTPRLDQLAAQSLRLGELGDALEGSIRTIGMIKWPGRITPRVNNEMVSVHDWAPTLAAIIGAEMPTDRPIDGVDQSAFLTGKQPKSNRESLITFIGNEIASVRWRQYRLYPKEFISTTGNPVMMGLAGRRAEGNGFPAIFNIEADHRRVPELSAAIP